MKQECLYRFCEERHALYFKGSFSQCLSNNLLPWSMTCVTRLRLKNTRVEGTQDVSHVLCIGNRTREMGSSAEEREGRIFSSGEEDREREQMACLLRCLFSRKESGKKKSPMYGQRMSLGCHLMEQIALI